MNRFRILTRISALFLSGVLALPGPARQVPAGPARTSPEPGRSTLRSNSAAQSGTEEELAARFRRPPPQVFAGAEEWGEGTWNRFYELNAKEGSPLFEAFENVLEAYLLSSSAVPTEESLWDAFWNEIPEKDSLLSEAVRAFQKRGIVFIFMPGVSLLYDRDRKAAVLLIGDERRFQLIVALLKESPQRWELLADNYPVGFETDGKLIVGCDPLVKAGKHNIQFDPPTQKGDEMEVQIIRRFVPIQRVVWLTPQNLTDLSEQAFQAALFEEDLSPNIPEPFLKALLSQPRTVVSVPTHAPVEWYRRDVVPLVTAAGAEEQVKVWLEAPRAYLSGALEGFKVWELLKPLKKPGTNWVEGTVDGVPTMIGLEKRARKALQASRMPRAFRLYVQMGALSKEQIAALYEWLGVEMQVLPDELAKDRLQEILREIRRPRAEQPQPPESLLVLNRETFEQFDKELADFDPFKVPAVIVGVREGALARAEFPAVLSYLSDLLNEAGMLGHLVMDRLEDSFSSESERATWLLRSSA